MKELKKKLKVMLESNTVFKSNDLYEMGEAEGRVAVCRMVLDALDEIDAGDKYVCGWHKDDVLIKARTLGVELSDDEAREILDTIQKGFDGEYGVNWETLAYAVEQYDKERRAVKATKKFQLNWFAPEYEPRQIYQNEYFFTEGRGYSDHEIEQILALDVGQEVNLLCHSIRRVE